MESIKEIINQKTKREIESKEIKKEINEMQKSNYLSLEEACHEFKKRNKELIQNLIIFNNYNFNLKDKKKYLTFEFLILFISNKENIKEDVKINYQKINEKLKNLRNNYTLIIKYVINNNEIIEDLNYIPDNLSPFDYYSSISFLKNYKWNWKNNYLFLLGDNEFYKQLIYSVLIQNKNINGIIDENNEDNLLKEIFKREITFKEKIEMFNEENLSYIKKKYFGEIEKDDINLFTEISEKIKEKQIILDENDIQIIDFIQKTTNISQEQEIIKKKKQEREREKEREGILKEVNVKEGNVKEGNVKEGNVKEGNLKEDNLKEDNLKEDNLKEDNLKEDKLKEDNLKEDNLKEDNIKEDNIKEDNIKEDNLKEDNLKEDKLKEDNLKEDNIKEDNLKEDKLKEDNIKEDNLKEDNIKEDNIKEDILKKDNLKEDNLKDQNYKANKKDDNKIKKEEKNENNNEIKKEEKDDIKENNNEIKEGKNEEINMEKKIDKNDLSNEYQKQEIKHIKRINLSFSLNFNNRNVITNIPKNSKLSFNTFFCNSFHSKCHSLELIEKKENNKIKIPNFKSPLYNHNEIKTTLKISNNIYLIDNKIYNIPIYDYNLDKSLIGKFKIEIPFNHYNLNYLLENQLIKTAICEYCLRHFNILMFKKGINLKINSNDLYEISFYNSKFLFCEDLIENYKSKFDKDIIETFSHFSYCFSYGNFLIDNIIEFNGKIYKFKLYRADNHKYSFFIKFFNEHKCNKFCHELNLENENFFIVISQENTNLIICDLCKKIFENGKEEENNDNQLKSLCKECKEKTISSKNKLLCIMCNTLFDYYHYFYITKKKELPNLCNNCSKINN